MEAHPQSGWLCELVVGSDDARVKECEFVELLVDTRASEHVCGPQGEVGSVGCVGCVGGVGVCVCGVGGWVCGCVGVVLGVFNCVCWVCCVCCVEDFWWASSRYSRPRPPSAGPPKISLFFSLPPEISFFLLSLGASPDSPRTPNVHISGPRPSKAPPKCHEKTSHEREERMKFPVGERKKSAKFWAPHPPGPTTRPAHHPPPPQRTPHLSTKKKNAQMRSGQIRSHNIGQIRPNTVGQMRPVKFGQMWYWPNSVWPNQVWPNAVATVGHSGPTETERN